MHSTRVKNKNNTMGGVAIWTIIIVAGVISIGFLLGLQVKEYLFYNEAPSIWPSSGAVQAQVAAPVAPPAELPAPEVDESTKQDETAEETKSEEDQAEPDEPAITEE